MSRKAIKNYLYQLHRMFSGGDAREESYYSILEDFLQEMWKINNSERPRIVIMPKKTEAGFPDMSVKKDNRGVIGYIEAKAPLKDLDRAEES
ncbi:MAG: hypothetical protein GY940_29875, partial [bacterium]|nr:hypothetical protein [bacterium]